MYIALITISLLLIASLYINYNLLKKVEKYEDAIMSKDEFVDKLQEISSKSYSKLVELDLNQAFESDDEVGFFFKNLKEIIIAIDAYSKNYVK